MSRYPTEPFLPHSWSVLTLSVRVPGAYLPALFALALALGSAGCDSGPPPVPAVSSAPLGRIITNGDPAWIAINGQTVSAGTLAPLGVEVTDEPVIVQSGVPFDVTTATFVSPGCIRVAPSVVTTNDRTITIDVHDYILDVECAFILTTFPRTDRVSISTPGLAEVVVRGEQFNAGQGLTPAEFRFEVVVQ